MSTRYDRQAREVPGFARWRMPVAGLALMGLYIGASIVAGILLAVVLIGVVGDSSDPFADLENLTLDTREPGLLALTLGSIAILLPLVLLAVRIVGLKPGYLSSVTGRVRWRWLGLMAAVAFPLYAVMLGLSLAIENANGSAGIGGPQALDSTAVVAIIVVLLLVPPQAAAEEYLFRGYLLQLIGSWTRFVVIGVVVTTLLFVLAHGYGFWGLVDVGIFGLGACIVTLRTGGLEAAIAMHTANNVLLFLYEAVGILRPTYGLDDPTAIVVLPTVLTTTLFVLMAEFLARRTNLTTRRAPIIPPPPRWAPQPAWGQPYPVQPYPVQAYAPQPYAPQPYAPQPYAPQPYAPQPYAPQPYAPQPYALRAPSPTSLHPDTPDYPGDLPAGWPGDPR